MGRHTRALAALLLTLALLLTGCGVTELNAAGYVQGLLDETYKGIWEETYLALVDLTEEEAAASYQDGLEAEYLRFAEYFQLNKYAVSQEKRAAFVEYLGQTYAKARYSVDHATRSESGAWLVEVTVQPILTLAELAKQVPALRAQFNALEDIAPGDREEVWAGMVLEACQSADMEYGEKTTIAVRLAPDEDGYYSIGTQDFYNLDALILTYES